MPFPIPPKLIHVSVATSTISTPFQMGCKSITGLPPAVNLLSPMKVERDTTWEQGAFLKKTKQWPRLVDLETSPVPINHCFFHIRQVKPPNRKGSQCWLKKISTHRQIKQWFPPNLILHQCYLWFSLILCELAFWFTAFMVGILKRISSLK